MSLRTAVDEVAVVGGDPGERPSGILVDERASRSARARKRGNLYVLVEVTGPALGRDLIARHLLETVRDAYYAWQGSITAGLQQAIHEVNDSLFAENRNSLPSEQRTAGVSCAVLRDDDLFLAQAGPASVFFSHEDDVTRFPDVSPWLDGTSAEDADVAPLGARREVNVALYHTPVSDGDVILLVESTFVRSHSPEKLPTLLTRTPAEQMPSALRAAARGSDLSALIVRVGAKSVGEAAAEAALPAGAPLAGQRAGESLQERATTLVGQIPLNETLRKAERGAVALLGSLWGGLATLLKRMLPGQVGPEATTRKPMAQARRVKGELGKHPMEETQVQPRTNSLRRLLTGLAIAIPVIAGLIVLAKVVQRSQNQKEEIEALWTNASQSWDQAEAASDKATKRVDLKAAAGYLEDLIARQPDNLEAAKELQKKVVARQDEIDLVRRIANLYGLKTYAAGAKLTRVVVQDFDIYVLDENAGKVYHHALDTSQQKLKAGTEDTVLVQKGTQVGGVLVGDLVDMAWVPVGEGRPQPGLVILESNRNFLDYTPVTETLAPLRPAGADGWQFPQRVAGRTPGRVYVLDRAADKIWRYPSTSDGFAAPDDWLTQAMDLDGVIDMGVGDSIYLLYAAGTISRLSAGAPDTFSTTDWDLPPSNPSAIVARPSDEAKSIYVADRGNSRIVQAGADGRFERQFKLDVSTTRTADVLSSVSSLFVNELDKLVFFTSGNTLYLFLLP
jgi:hypothetical protein